VKVEEEEGEEEEDFTLPKFKLENKQISSDERIKL
jgi:hypothetical protein